MDSCKISDVTLQQVMPVLLEQLSAGNSVRLYPKGTSMLPMLRQGVDSVLLSPLPERLKKYDLPLYQRKSGQYVLHRICGAGETYTCIGDNQLEYEKGLSHDQMIAVVTAFYRGEKAFEVTKPSYQIYCRFWHYTRPVRRLWRGGKRFLRRCLK